MKKIYTFITIVLLSGCASTNVEEMHLTTRTVSLKVLGGTIIDFEKKTEGLDVGNATIVKDPPPITEAR